MANHSKWANGQISALVEIGIDVADAQRSTNWVLSNLPNGEDPATWVPTAAQLNTPLDAVDVLDASADWYARDSVPPKFKRILDAQEAR